MKRVWCLYRVSSKGQVDHDDIPMQRIACQEYAQTHPDWQIMNEVYEKGVSGFKTSADDRDALIDLRAAARAKKFDVLLVFMKDRIGRKEDETPFVVKWFIDQGIEIWSAKEGQTRIDSHADILTNFIYYWLASGEVKNLSMRVRTKHHQMAMEGTYRGGYVALGYDAMHTGRTNKKGHPVRDYVINEEEAKIVTAIFQKVVDEGYGSIRLANWLNDHDIPTKRKANMWRATTLRSLLRNPIYVGRLRFSSDISEEIPGLRLIDDYYFGKANEIIQGRVLAQDEQRKGPARSTVRGLLAGIIFCGECGARMSFNHDANTKTLADGTERVYVRNAYRCSQKINRTSSCSGQYSYKSEPVEEKVLRVVRRFFDNVRKTPEEDMLAAAVLQKDGIEKAALKNAEAELTKAKHDLDALENEAMKAITGTSQLDLSVVNKLIQKQQAVLEVAQLTYEGVADDLTMKAEQEAYKKAEVAMIKSWADTFDAMDFDAKRTVLTTIIDKVEVSTGNKILIQVNLTMRQFWGDVIAA